MKFLAPVLLLAFCMGASAQVAELPSEIPKDFDLQLPMYDYTRTTVMIPMRDGVKLNTVIWSPKRSTPMPMVLTRTPYDANGRQGWTSRPTSPTAVAAVPLPDAPLLANGYIRIYQDIRGKYGSEGNFTVNLPLRGPENAGPVDEATDAWDTIEWLVKNVPNNNGRVGTIGVSYEGWTTLMSLFNAHPALKAALPMNAMVDGWIGDDWYHNGAFRQFTLGYIYGHTTVKDATSIPFGKRDSYNAYLEAGSANDMAKRFKAEQLPAWRKLIDNPAYTAFWQEQAVDKLLLRTTTSVPTLTVHGLFDQEDIYGPIASYLALEKSDPRNDHNFLAIGPWFHGQQDPWFHTESGSHTGPFEWDSDTTRYFLDKVMLPFFNQYLKDIKPATPIPPVRAFLTGENEWRSYDKWPAPQATARKLYLNDGHALSFKPSTAKNSFDEYVSDPAKPVPYRVQPIIPNDSPGTTWGKWLVDDQRPFGSRPDVLTYVSEPLTEPLTVAGAVNAVIKASTTGTDADWVVKLIDVYPDEVPTNIDLGGYQVMVSADIMRGRYRESIEKAQPIRAGAVLDYAVRMPHAHHTFLPGHRLMVQVQSSWFPLYDRNPQTFVANIAYATPESYRKATQRIFTSASQGSYLELQVTP